MSNTNTQQAGLPAQGASIAEAPVAKKPKITFTRYEKFIIAIVAIIQFSVVLDFMVLSPLSYILLPALDITTAQFGLVVSAYAFSAGASGLLAAGFADKYDRKKLLVFFYSGFILGTVLCAMAPTYPLLMMARIVTGIFGGVIGSITMAIVTDLFKMDVRGRVMGFVQMAFAGSQVLGIPVGLKLAQMYNWHAAFYMIAGFSVFVAAAIIVYMKPVAGHLELKSERRAVDHLIKTISNRNYLKAFAATVLLATGGFMMMPFGSVFSTNNLHVSEDDVWVLFGITGIFSMIFGPLVGLASDKVGKYKMFVLGSILSIIMVIIYTHLGPIPFWLVVMLNVILFVGISSRMIASSALLSAIPSPADRGAFMSINASIQQISGGIAAAIAGLIVYQSSSGALENYPTLGYVVSATSLITIGFMYILNTHIRKTSGAAPTKH
jgi:predicted MFS family arabinose efflux permease